MKGAIVATLVAGTLAGDVRNNIAKDGTRKIKHMVQILMENRPIDHTFGCMAGEGIIGLEGINGSHTLPKDPDDPSKGSVNVTCGTANYVCKHGPPYSMWDLKVKKGSNDHTYPYGPQDDKYSYENGADENAIMMFSSEQLPIKTAVAKQFAVFNHLHGAIPSFSEPNHMMTHSGTSCHLSTNPSSKCPTSVWPQPTIYDTLDKDGVSFKLFSNSTNGACPEGGMAGVARHKDNCFNHTEFYKLAASGDLPSHSYLSPPGEACDHPCHDIAKGERFLKDVYEALRAGPCWENTLLFVAYDDGGGFYDHVTPPSEGVAADDSPCVLGKNPGCSLHPELFDFKRLGIRVTSYVISPWIPANTAVQRPTGPTPTSQFDLTSGIATVKNLFNLSSFLTKRDAWAGTFDELLTLDEARTDCPLHFPEPPPVAAPWTCPGCQNTESELRRLEVADGPEGQHCPASTGVCEGTAAVTQKQRRMINHLMSTGVTTEADQPDWDTLTFAEAEEWIEHHSGKWMELPAPPKLSDEEYDRWTAVAR